MKIDKKLVIEYKDLLEDVGTGNNMDFYLMDEKRLRYKFNEINFDENKFYECFDMDTLEIAEPPTQYQMQVNAPGLSMDPAVITQKMKDRGMSEGQIKHLLEGKRFGDGEDFADYLNLLGL